MASPSSPARRRTITASASLLALASSLAIAGAAHAGPSGGVVTGGSAAITGEGSGHVTVTQTSDRAIVDWNSFSIGTGESARFVQPGATSVTVNRVTGADPSSILGNLTANGQIVLINRNGIAFGKDSTVDVGGLVATTADIDRNAFLSTGALSFSGGGAVPGASIVNEGRISVRDAGLAALVAPSVRNSGSIVANLGRVALGAGTGFTVDFYGDGLINFAPDGIVAATVGDGSAALVENDGLIAASGGRIVLSAAAARDVVNASVNVTGVVRADSISQKGGSILLSGPGAVTAMGRVTADSEKAAGGNVAINGGSVSLGGLVSASGANGGAVHVEAAGLLSLAENVDALGHLGKGGTLSFAAGRIIETASSRNDASGLIDGGSIRAVTDGGFATSGTYAADGRYGAGGRIDLSGGAVSLLSTRISARGRQAGGLVRIGGAFQGGKTADSTRTYHQSFLGRWGAQSALPNADTLFVGNATSIDVSASGGNGGTAVFWSNRETTFLGAVDARGGSGGSVEISSAGSLKRAALDRVTTGAGGHLLLDPKNIVIGTVDDVESWQYAAILGAVYANDSNPDAFTDTIGASIDTSDAFGVSIALNAAGDRMAVGASGDDGVGNAVLNMGAVYLFSFADSSFSGGTLAGIIGKGYAGGNSIDVNSLSGADGFGTSVALNAAGNRLVVGAYGDDGFGEGNSAAGAVYLFTFADTDFSGGTHVGTIGKGYAGAGDFDLTPLENDDGFGRSVSLNAAGDRLAIGAWTDDGFANGAADSGAVYLLSFTDTAFGGASHSGTIGAGYVGAGDVSLSGPVTDGDFLGVSVALNAAGDRLAIGAAGDDGAGDAASASGAIHLISFTDTDFSGGTRAGTIGKGYANAGDTNIAALAAGDSFGYSVALNAAGNRLATGALGDAGSGDTTVGAGAVYLLSFSDGNFSGGAQTAIVGKGYSGGKNIGIPEIEGSDAFGFSVALNAVGDRLAIGAYGDDGGNNASTGAGAVYLLGFSDGNFSNGTVRGVIGRDSWHNGDIDISALESGDSFGVSIALNGLGDRMAVGAWADSGAGNVTSGAGAVYLFSFDDANFSGGTLSGIIGKGYTGGNNVDMSGLELNDWFGSGVALNDVGDRLAVGALGDDGGSTTNSGAVYLFTFSDDDFSDGTHVGTVGKGYGVDVSNLALNDQFGISVALNAAGDRLAVGAIGDKGANNDLTSAGAAYLIRFDDSDFTGGVLAGVVGADYAGANDIDVTPLGSSDQFGVSVALNGAGDRLAVGAIGDAGSGDSAGASGAVYLFSFGDDDFTGGSHTGTAGKGYTGGANVNVSALEASDQFGRGISLNGAGDRLAVGAFGDGGNANSAAGSGAVYLLSFADGDFSGGSVTATLGKNYSGSDKLNVMPLDNGDQFGVAVALNAAGDRLAVGATGDGGASNRTAVSGAVYLFRFEDTNFYGGSLVGVVGDGYARTGDLALNAVPDTGEQFGMSVALNGAGDRLAVGAYADNGAGNAAAAAGAVYLFSFSDDQYSDGALEAIVGKGYVGGENVNVAQLEAGDGFGFSVALNDGGNRMAVGAWADAGLGNTTGSAGAVYLFSFSDGSFADGAHVGTIGKGYTGTGNIDLTQLASADRFGTSVALNAAGDRLAVGAYLDDGVSGGANDNYGAVYLFRFTDTDFGGATHSGTVGKGYVGVGDVNLAGLETTDYFGVSVALNGTGDRLAAGATGDDGSGNGTADAGAVHLLTFTNGDFGGGALAGTIGKGYSGGKSRDVSVLEGSDQFGRSVALTGDGDYLVAGANYDDGAGNAVQNAGALYLFTFSDTSFTGGVHKGTIGSGYTGTFDTALTLGADDNIGVSAALSANGYRLASGANGSDGANDSISNSGAVYLFTTELAAAGGLSYGDDPDATVNVSAASLAALLAAGTNLTLQASNDITVSAALTVNNALGDGGDLTLQAGRSVLVNASITTDNGDLTIIANDTLANGVVDAYRDTGSAAVTMGVGTTITAGTGSVTIDLRDGAGKTNTAGGDITLRAITAGALTVTNASTAGDILLNGNITTSGAQDYTSERDIKLAASTTLTVTGAATLSMDAARQVSLTTGAKIENTYAGGLTPFAAIDITANRRATADAGTLSGIDLNGAIIRTAAGAAGSIALSAHGGASDGRGINMLGGSTIEALGSGTIALHGTSGTGSGGTTYGVFLHQSSQVVGTNGDIEITGEAVGSGVAPGLYVFNGSQVRTTGTGDIALIGSAVAGGQGVWIASSSAGVHTMSGDISITATSGDGGQPDFTIGSGGTLGSVNTNDITINADTIGFTGTVSGNGILTIQSRTDGRTIGLGDGTGDLALAATSLANIQNGFSEIVIGNADAGAITVGNGLSAFADNLHLESAGALAIGGTLSTGSNRLTLDIAGGATQTEAITAGQLLLLGAGADYTLDHAGNAVTTLAASVGTGDIVLNNAGAVNLTVGTIGSTTGITAATLTLTSTNAGSDILINNAVTTTGAQDYTSERDIKLAASTTLTVSGAATLTMDAARQVSLGASSKIENSYGSDLTGFDAIVLSGNRRVIADTGILSGVDFGAGAIVRTAAGGAGNIDISGRGGATTGHGIALVTTATIESLGAGNITLTGDAVNGTSNYSGIFIGGGSTVSTVNGDIEVTAVSSGAGGNYPALYMLGGVSASIQSSGTGDITIQGTRTTGDGEGVWIGLAGAKVQTASGDISITGASALSTRDAVRIAGSGQVLTTAGGDITLEGTAATGGVGKDVGTLASSILGGASTNDITINANTVSLAGTTTGAGTLTFQPRTDGRSIGLGAGAGDLNISAATLATITNGFAEIVIGNADAGAITVGSGLSAFVDNLRLVGSQTLSVGSALSVGSNRLTFDIAGATSQTAAITADRLLLLNATGAYTLTNSGNAIGTLAGDTGTIALTHSGSGNLTVGTIDTTAGIDATSVAITTTQSTAGLIFNQDVTTTGAQTYGAPGTITVNAGADLAVSGKATLALTAGARILLSGGTLANSYTSDSDDFEAITLKANEAGTGTGSGDAAIKLAGGASISTAAGGGGAISLLGKGGASISHGIFVDGSTIESLGAGTLTLTGTGGTAAGGTNIGIYLKGTDTDVVSNSGAMLISGTGGASTGPQNYGVHIHDGATIASTGTGDDAAAIEIIGAAGGTGSGATNIGVYVADTGAAITSIDGDISVTGSGAAASTSNNNIGVRLLNNARIESTGTTANAAKITIIGNAGGTGALSANNQGVSMQSATVEIASAFGDISITGTGSATAGAANNHGIHILEGAHITSTGTTAGAAKITLSGEGGGDAASATANTNIGIYVSSPNTLIESVVGDITMTGTGGAGSDGVDAHHYGIQLGLGTQVKSTGSDADAADIIISGTGGSGTGNKRNGVYLNAVEALLSDAGNITVTARGGASGGGTGNDGLYVSGAGAKIQSSSGEIVVDAAKGGGTGKDFNNLTGSTAVQSTTGRWIIYLSHPGDSTLNNLASGSLPIWGQTIGTLAPASVGAGNRYVFAHQPTLTIATSFSDSKVYGSAYTFPAAVSGTNYTISGLVNAASYQNVWTQETLLNIGLSGAPEFSSVGAAADADVAGSPYAISIANGTLASSAGYQFGTPSSTGTLTVTAKALTLSGVSAAGRDYDGSTDADLSGGTLGGVVGSDDVEFAAGSGAFASKNVGTWAITASGYSLTGDDAGNYTLTQPTVADATISAKALTLSGVSAAGRDYDGGTDADLSGGTLVGVVGSEDVEFAAGTGAFASKNVGTWTITATGYALTGTDAGNYTLAQPAVANASITAKALTLAGVTADGKAYDGNTDADLSGGSLGGVVGLEDVGFSAGTGAFANKNVGTWAITASGYALTGTDAGNYTLTQPSVANATITAKALTLTGVSAAGKTYDGNTDADLSGGSLGGVIGLEDVGFSAGAGTFASKDVGTWTITASGYTLTGTDAGNYTLSQPVVADATITAKALTLTGVSAAGKTYDGNTDADLSGGSLSGVVGLEDVGFSAGAGVFASENVGTWAISASGYSLTGADAGNYTLSQPTVANATITAKALTLSGVTASGKIYDGDTVADLSGGSLSGVVGLDDVAFSDGSGVFASKNVGTWTITASGYSLTGTDAGNYTLSQPAVADATITAKVLAAGVAALGKIYDGGLAALLQFTTGDILGSDDVAFDYDAVFADKNAGSGKAVSLTGSVTLTGGDAGNYTLSLDPAEIAALSADITARTLTVTAVGALDKVYDGGSDAALTLTTADILGGDSVGFDYDATFADKNAGTGKAVSVGGGVTLSGSDGGNYALVLDPALLIGLSADIAKKSLTITSVGTLAKTYDGTAETALDIATADIVAGDAIGFDYEALTADANAGTDKAVAVTGGTVTLTGADADNYDLGYDPALLTGLTVDIDARTLTVTSVAALDKVYDGSVAAMLDFGTADILAGDSVDFDYAAAFADKNVGAGKAVTATGSVSLSGGDAGNYQLVLDTALLSNLEADITARTLTISDVAALNKTYDGTRTATLGFTADALGGDDIGFDYEALFADRNAGTGKAIDITGGTVTLSGGDAGNYTLALDPALLAGLTADIAKKSLIVTDVAGAAKTYDGTRDAELDFTTGDILAGDDIGFDYEALTADRNAGTGKVITVTGGAVALAGGDAGNYDLVLDGALLEGLTTDIAARTITVSDVAALGKVYDGTVAAALAFTAGGIVGDDAVSFGYDAQFADKNVGSGKAVSVTGSVALAGEDAGNYALVLDPALLTGLAADITAKTLTITDVLGLAKTYDGTRGAALDFATDDMIAGDTVGFDYEALFSDKNAGIGKAITVTGGVVTLTGADAGNYALVLDTVLLGGLSADIAKKSLTVSDVAVQDKTYDGTRGATLDFTTGDILAGDDIGFDYEALAADRNAGSGKAVSVTGNVVMLSGEDAGNYDLTLDPDLLGGLTTDVAAKALLVIADDKTRARFMSNPAFTYRLVGLAEGDDASVVSGVTLGTNAGEASPVGAYVIEAANGSSANYVLSYQSGTLTITGDLVPPFDQDRIVHAPGLFTTGDAGSGWQLTSTGSAPTLHDLAGYTVESVDAVKADARGPFCSDRRQAGQGRRMLPYLQLNMSGRALYCLGSPARQPQ